MDLEISRSNWESLSTIERRNKLLEFEEACKVKDDSEHVEIKPNHIYCNGVYGREITIPAGVALVGEIHLTDQINVVSKGKIRVATEEGVKEITAPATFISPAGTKRAGFALEETVWTVFLATKLTDHKQIHKEFIAPSYELLDKQLEKNKCLS